jgi:hypothetical protein
MPDQPPAFEMRCETCDATWTPNAEGVPNEAPACFGQDGHVHHLYIDGVRAKVPSQGAKSA